MLVFFKQKTADEMRISDRSSDVCSSDLNGEGKKAIAPIRAYFDHVLANRPTIGLEFIPVAPGQGTSTCTDRWCWCDALFMAPPTMLRLAQDGRPPLRRFSHRGMESGDRLSLRPGGAALFSRPPLFPPARIPKNGR